MTALTPQQMWELADKAHDSMLGWISQIESEWGSGAGPDALREKGDEDVLLADSVAAALRTAADQLEAVQAVLAEAHDKFAATYDAERMTGRGPSSIGVAGAPLASSVQRALDMLRAKANANIERLTADTAPQEPNRG